MNDYYTDFEELRPIGEASHIPDEKLSECGDSAAHRQRVATTEKGYPNDATESNTECRSCGASVPDGQTKCRFCLTNHLERVTPLVRTSQRRRRSSASST